MSQAISLTRPVCFRKPSRRPPPLSPLKILLVAIYVLPPRQLAGWQVCRHIIPKRLRMIHKSPFAFMEYSPSCERVSDGRSYQLAPMIRGALGPFTGPIDESQTLPIFTNMCQSLNEIPTEPPRDRETTYVFARVGESYGISESSSEGPSHQPVRCGGGGGGGGGGIGTPGTHAMGTNRGGPPLASAGGPPHPRFVRSWSIPAGDPPAAMPPHRPA